MQAIHIFTAGTHTTASGTEITLQIKELNDVVKTYNMKKHTAPIVLGHPKDDAPAQGWIAELYLDEDKLFARPFDVNEEFAQGIKSGLYKKISASFYAPDDTNNPTPGFWHLRHVGVLGASIPALKDMQTMNFTETHADNNPISLYITHHINAMQKTGQLTPVKAEKLHNFFRTQTNADVHFSEEHHPSQSLNFLQILQEILPTDIHFTELSPYTQEASQKSDPNDLIEKAYALQQKAKEKNTVISFAEAINIASLS